MTDLYVDCDSCGALTTADPGDKVREFIQKLKEAGWDVDRDDERAYCPG